MPWSSQSTEQTKTTEAQVKISKVPPWPQSAQNKSCEKDASILSSLKEVAKLVIAVTDDSSSDEESTQCEDTDKPCSPPLKPKSTGLLLVDEGTKDSDSDCKGILTTAKKDRNISITLRTDDPDDSVYAAVHGGAKLTFIPTQCNTLASKLSKGKLTDDNDEIDICLQKLRKENAMKETEELKGDSISHTEISKMQVLSKSEMKNIKNLPVPKPTHASFELQRKMYQKLVDQYDDFERECENADLDPEKIDLASYAEESWSYIAKAVVDPYLLNGSHLAEVGRVIVTRALDDTGYFKVSVQLIDFISKKEVKGKSSELPKTHFRDGVVDACDEALGLWDSYVDMGLHYCLTLMEFISRVFYTSSFSGSHKDDLSSVMLDLLFIVAKPPAVSSFELTQHLCCVLHESGEILDNSNPKKMDSVIDKLRDAITDPDNDPEIRHMLLGPVELRACGWKFSSSAQKYYFS